MFWAAARGLRALASVGACHALQQLLRVLHGLRAFDQLDQVAQQLLVPPPAGVLQ